MFRALKPAFKSPEKRELSSLFLYAAVAIPVFYLPALFYGPHTNFAVIDNWRFWIIHLWVEGFFELFATVLVAIMFHQMGVVSTKTATRLIYLDAILYLSGGIIGTGHHWYFTGQGTLNMGLAACFSALEVVPLTLLTLDAWDFIKLRKAQCSACGQDLAWGQKWSIYFLMAVGVWNFVGAGIFGFLINLPIVSYFEVGTIAHPQSRTRRIVWRLWDVGPGSPGLLLEGHAIRRDMEGDAEVRPGGLLGRQCGPRAHDRPGSVPRRSNPALGFHRQRVLARAPPDIPDGRHLPQAGMAAHGGGCGLPLRRRPAHHAGRVAQCMEKGSLSHGVEAASHREAFVRRAVFQQALQMGGDAREAASQLID